MSIISSFTQIDKKHMTSNTSFSQAKFGEYQRLISERRGISLLSNNVSMDSTKIGV